MLEPFGIVDFVDDEHTPAHLINLREYASRLLDFFGSILLHLEHFHAVRRDIVMKIYCLYCVRSHWWHLFRLITMTM